MPIEKPDTQAYRIKPLWLFCKGLFRQLNLRARVAKTRLSPLRHARVPGKSTAKQGNAERLPKLAKFAGCAAHREFSELLCAAAQQIALSFSHTEMIAFSSARKEIISRRARSIPWQSQNVPLDAAICVGCGSLQLKAMGRPLPVRIVSSTAASYCSTLRTTTALAKPCGVTLMLIKLSPGGTPSSTTG